MENPSRVCVLGLGYVGLPVAVLAAHAGYEVLGVDTSLRVREAILGHRLHLSEPGLAGLVREVVEEGRLRVSGVPAEAGVFLIAVPTPIREDRTCDLDAVAGAIRDIVPHLERGNLVIVESTVRPGSIYEVVVPLLEESGLRVGPDLHLAYCPERVLPGRVLDELVHTERVIGAHDEDSARLATRFYSSFVRASLHLTRVEEAVVVKLAENAYRDVNVAFANELANMSEALGLDVWEIVALANRHPRVNILKPGPGVGGHCIPVDPWFLIERCPEHTTLVAAARRINDDRPARLAEAARRALEEVPEKPGRVAALGVTYKADTGDLRGSPALEILRRLGEAGLEVRVADPQADPADCPFPLTSVEEAARGADLLVVLADHSEFRDLAASEVLEGMRHRLVLDCRGLWTRQEVEDAGGRWIGTLAAPPT